MFSYTKDNELELQCDRCCRAIPREYYLLLITQYSGYEPLGQVPMITAKYTLCKNCNIVVKGILKEVV